MCRCESQEKSAGFTAASLATLAEEFISLVLRKHADLLIQPQSVIVQTLLPSLLSAIR